MYLIYQAFTSEDIGESLHKSNKKTRGLPPQRFAQLLKIMAKTRIATLTPIDALLLREVFNEYIESKQKLLKHKNLAPITRHFIQERIDNITELKIKIFKQ